MLRAQGERAAAYLQAQGQAKAIEKTFAAIKAGRPTPEMLAYQYLQTLPAIANGAGNTFWVIPSEMTSALKAVTSAFGGDTAAAGEAAEPPEARQGTGGNGAMPPQLSLPSQMSLPPQAPAPEELLANERKALE